ncbi:MAG: hypothetical protein HY266_06820 [Deltaproteobacteria bacterium]|nr:hypothetical protein [Deltaproteobacteria bacterium]
MKRFFAIVLLGAAFAMNMGMICKSLCMAGHGNMNHASHNMAKHEMPKDEMCPITHEAQHNMSHQAHHTMPDASIKCNCSADQEASLEYELTLAESAGDLKPHLHIISKIHSQKTIFLSSDPSPIEGPPKLLS